MRGERSVFLEKHRERVVDGACDAYALAEVVLTEDQERKLLFLRIALDEQDVRPGAVDQKTFMKLRIAGPRMTRNIAGKMKPTVGKSIFTGAFIARSSAAA